MKRGSVALVVTVLLAAAAAAAVFLYVTNVRQNAETGGGTVSVVVSKQDIPASTDLDPLIDEQAFTTKSVPSDDLVEGAVTDVFQLRGQRTAYPILAGEQISAARLQGKLQAAGGLLGIPDGSQALALTLESQRVVGGALQQSDNVTVYGTFDRPNGGQITRILVPDALVLSVTTETVTLALDPHDAELVIYTQEQGHVWLTLLPPNQAGVMVPPVVSANVR
jgi:Flp pilus assembly protein CpaB